MSSAFSLKMLSPIALSDIQLLADYREKVTEIEQLASEVDALSEETTTLFTNYADIKRTALPQQTPAPQFLKLQEAYQQVVSGRLKSTDYYQEFKSTYGDAVLDRHALDQKNQAIFDSDASFEAYLTIYAIYVHQGRRELVKDMKDIAVNDSIPAEKTLEEQIERSAQTIAQHKLFREDLQLKSKFYTTSIAWENYKATTFKQLGLIHTACEALGLTSRRIHRP